ncbi:MAG: nodulation protein NfeD [Marinilabiliaceae bacterium]|nr:nodulation protein NfeD [Marinilabiliaceae bacterium]
MLFTSLTAFSNDSTESSQNIVYVLKIQREIGSTSWVHTQEAFKEAYQLKSKCILIHMNTYGGQVVFADSIRTKILNSSIPVHVFIDNNAASAGALISIACDSIYMRAGANIGAATVVDQSGQKMPDKYQSYMRSTIRATAEAHGKDTIITNNDTIVKWVRDPQIAEAMVDESIYIPNIVDTGKILTFTTQEAIKNNFCEAEANNINEVITLLKINNYKIVTFEPSFYDGIKGLLTSPILQGILILIIIGGIYFELQTPGVGFPLIASIIAAVIYFSPLYIDGLAENWEILIFIIGIILIGLEIFVIPGFGIAGISGIILAITGLVLSMLNNIKFDFSGVEFEDLLQALLIVFLGFTGAFVSGIYLTHKLISTTGPLSKIALNTTQDIDNGYIGIDANLKNMVGKTGISDTILRPGGKVIIDNELYDAIAETSFIEKGTPIKVVRISSGQVVVSLNK